MSNLDNAQRRLAEGTSSWLHFEFHCNRGNLFNEKYISVPVGQLTSSLFEGRIKSEVNHPYLIPNEKKGRKPQIDFVVKKNDQISVAIESKWIGNTLISFSQILWDLIRLEQLTFHLGCDSYFLVSGFSKKMSSALSNTHFYRESPIMPFTKQLRQGIVLEMDKLDAETKSYINKKISKYKDLKIPKTMHFDIPHYFPKEVVNMSFQTYVWKVNSRKSVNRVTSL